jgi:hypothetical protein
MELSGVPFWDYAGFFAVTLSPEVDMTLYGKRANLRSLLITDITFRF